MHCVATYCIFSENQTLIPMKNFTLILCSLLFSSMAFGLDLTINIEVCESASSVRMTGPWWGWAANGGPEATDNGDGTWTIVLPDMTADMEFLLVVDGVQENLIQAMADGGSCAPVTDYWSYANRKWLTTDPNSINVTFNQCTACATTGTETDLLSGLSIYPNPATDVLMVSNDNNIDRVQMVNIFGSVVLDQTMQSNLGKLDVSAMSPGIYFVTVSANNQQVVRKITVK